MSPAQVNGDVPHSAFIDHILGYPVINDGISTFKSNPYGQKSIQLGDTAFKTFAQPIMPYFAKPYQYVSPYVKKADDLGDKTLSKVDEKFPIVKKPTEELYSDARSIIMFPLRIGQSGKEYVMNTYNSECKKVGGDNLMTYGKAAFTTALIITTDTLTTLSSFLGSKKEEAKQTMDEKANN
jgi:hypothetical protein